jgi:hypothetical protein
MRKEVTDKSVADRERGRREPNVVLLGPGV